MRAVLILFPTAGFVFWLGGFGTGKPDRVEITGFKPASGGYQPGDEAISSLRLKNNIPEKHTFWVGYSVRDTGGYWHDAPVRRLTLEPEESAPRETVWQVPDGPPPPSGSYDIAMSVWDEHPAGADEEKRLADARREGSFQVNSLQEDFDSLDESNWETSSKNLGRGRLEPENVSVENEKLRLKIPENSSDGGEIESKSLYQYGSYRARIKVADAPSSLTGFFLYREPDLENELDIEIFNDSSGRIMFTTYAGGEETNNVRKKLNFDPTKDFHDYRFDFYPDQAEFYVDGDLMHSFDEGLPEDPMSLYVNAWFPTWLSGEKPEKDGYTYVEWLQHYSTIQRS